MTFKFNFWKPSLINILAAPISYSPENCQADEATSDKDALCMLDCLQRDEMRESLTYLWALPKLPPREIRA